jgi:SAM-dependent methyltransferase
MATVTTLFGEVAAEYEDARPGYPASIAAAITRYLGAAPHTVAEVGAGTGKGTEVFALLGGDLICVEPDSRMAARLAAKIPDADVVISDFGSWIPPEGGVSVLAAALVWHLLDADRRCAIARSALAPDGVVALVGRRYVHADPVQGPALDETFEGFGLLRNPRPADWIHTDLTASGLFRGVTLSRHDTATTMPGPRFLRMISTFSPFRRLAPARRPELLTALTDVISATGGAVPLELRTTLTLGRAA